MTTVFPAIFEQNTDGSYTITFPDLPGCISEGKDLKNALFMAEDALTQWIVFLSDTESQIPAASDIRTITVPANGFASLVSAEIRNNCAVRRTISIPQWMDEAARKKGLSLSRILQDALSSRL